MAKSAQKPLRQEEFEALSEFRYRLRRFERFSEDAVRTFGVTPLQYLLLLHVKGFPGRAPATVGELAHRLQAKPHGVVALVTRCEEHGFVERRASLVDRRQGRSTCCPKASACWPTWRRCTARSCSRWETCSRCRASTMAPADMGRVTLSGWLRAFVPQPVNVSLREVAFGCLGALLGISSAAWLSRHLLAGLDPWFIAPIGASAVLLFAVPSSPLAQPWALLGGNACAALIGVTCAAQVGDPALACGLAVSLAIAAMFALRCLHPPGGAVALTAVLGGPAIRSLGYAFALWPVAIDSLLLLLAALLFNVSARRRYPHRAAPSVPAHASPLAEVGVTAKDLHEALRVRGELLDVSEDDLRDLFFEAEAVAFRRRHGPAEAPPESN